MMENSAELLDAQIIADSIVHFRDCKVISCGVSCNIRTGGSSLESRETIDLTFVRDIRAISETRSGGTRRNATECDGISLGYISTLPEFIPVTALIAITR